MYLDISVKIPSIKGKITKRIKNGTVYIEYEYERNYDPKRKFTTVKRATIGKECSDKTEFMCPNQNYLKYFPAAELPEEKDRSARSGYSLSFRAISPANESHHSCIIEPPDY